MPGRGQPWRKGGHIDDTIQSEDIEQGTIKLEDLATEVTDSIGDGGYNEVEDEGTPLTKRSKLNFIGNGVNAVDNGDTTDVTITQGGSVIGTQQDSIPISDVYPSASPSDSAIEANAITKRTVGTFGQQVRYIEFPLGQISEATYDWYPPQNWKPSAVPKLGLVIYWTSVAPSASPQQPDFQVLVVSRSAGDDIGAVSFGNAPVQFSDAFTGIDELHTQFKTISPIAGGASKGDWIQFKFRYKAPGTTGSASNLGGVFQLMGLRIQYEIDSETSSGLL